MVWNWKMNRVLLRRIRGDPHMITDSRCSLSYLLPFFGIPAGGCELAFYDLGFCRGIPDCQFADPEMNRAAGRV